MGTPEFAVPSLDILVKNGFNVVAVVTVPDKKQGRGQKLTYSPVKECALTHDIPVLQPEKLKDPGFIEELASFKADLQIVVAFRMLPVVVWDMPKLGTFNLHGSLLPDYRGAAPINWAIMNGEKETGVTTFFLKHEIDTGDVILQEKEPIGPDENVGDIYERLMYKGAQLVLETVKQIEADKVVTKPQKVLDSEVKHAPKLFKETCEIDWTRSSQEIHDFVRGLSPYPCAWTNLLDKNCKIFKTSMLDEQPESTDDIVSDNKKVIYKKTGDGYLAIEELQLQGKKRLTAVEFLCGNKF